MTAPANGSAHSVCDDAMRRAEHVLADLLERGVFVDSLPEIHSAVREEVNALRSARALADARAKQAAPDVGGTTLTLSIEEARLVRAALRFAAETADGWEGTAEAVVIDGVELAHDPLMALRKRIDGGVALNAARRCGQDRAEEFRALRAAEACSGSDDGEEDAA